MKRGLRLLQVLGILLLLPLAAQAQYAYEHAFLWTQADGMQDLGTIKGWQNSIAYAISDLGEVVGYDGLNSHETAFRWAPSAAMQHLPGSGTTDAVAAAVNSSGEIAGTYYLPGGAIHSFLWTKDGEIKDLGSLGGGSTVATGINRSGEVVGYSNTPTPGVDHAFLWTQSGGMQDLGALLGPASSSQAWAINDSGIVAGRSTAANGDDLAVVWKAGKIEILGPGLAQGINDLEQVVGESYTPKTPQRAFVWDAKSGMQLLPLLPGALASFGQGINNSGEAVGWSLGSGDFYQAFLWTSAAGTQDLGNLGGNYGAQAFAINDAGQVVGSSSIQ
jgi:probable HAF family extracellular repeat protein